MWPFRNTRKASSQRRSLPAAIPAVLRARYDAAQTTAENARHWAMADSLSADSATSADVAAGQPGVDQHLREFRRRQQVGGDRQVILRGHQRRGIPHVEHDGVDARVAGDVEAAGIAPQRAGAAGLLGLQVLVGGDLVSQSVLLNRAGVAAGPTGSGGVLLDRAVKGVGNKFPRGQCPLIGYLCRGAPTAPQNAERVCFCSGSCHIWYEIEIHLLGVRLVEC